MKKLAMWIMLGLCLIFAAGCEEAPEATTEEVLIIQDASDGAVIFKEEAKIAVLVPDQTKEEMKTLLTKLTDSLFLEGFQKENISVTDWIFEENSTQEEEKKHNIDLITEADLVLAGESGEYRSQILEACETAGVRVIFFYENGDVEEITKMAVKHINGETADSHTDIEN